MKRTIFSALCLLLSASWFLAGCGSGGKIAAVVNGHVITVEEVDTRMANLGASAREALGDDRGRLLEQIIMEAVLIQEARRRGLHREAEVKTLVAAARRQIVVTRLLTVLKLEGSSEVTDQQVAQFYNTNRTRFQEPETFRASHILVADEETAKKALERVSGGEPFDKVANEISTDPSRARGGDIGIFARGQILPEFEAACARLEPGQLSDVVKSSLGYHVILLTEHKASRQVPLEEIKDQIKGQLLARDHQLHLETSVKQLRSEAQVQIQDSSLAASLDSNRIPDSASIQDSNS